MNASSHLPVALVATGKVTLSSGTVFGDVHYGTYSAANITYVNGAPIKESLVERVALAVLFTSASSAMQGLSATLNGYAPNNTTASRPPNQNQTVQFTGGDADLNVFQLSSDLFNGTTQFHFVVPLGSAAIINVTGKSPVIQYAGFDGAVPSNGKILWNFPDATSLTIKSVTFPGSILAPKASASFYYGQINGTVVVKSANPASMEFHWAPFHGLAASGCLDWDASWSCSRDTYLDDTGQVVFPAPEAGFLEIAGGDYIAEGVNRSSPTHRIWYAFQPAWLTPKDMPLAVFFNGGPGSSTSALMFSFNTAPMTLDPAVTHSITYNPNTWTKFANLLYIDAPATGFSYPLRNDDNNEPDIGIDIDSDAGIFLRVIVQFLARHPAVQGNPVILVGESYGGIRATLMLKYLYAYKSLMDGVSAYQDKQLHEDLTSYFNAVFKTPNPDAGTIAKRFGSQVLIEPAVAGRHQQNKIAANMSLQGCADPCTNDPHCPAMCYQSYSDPTANPPILILPTCDAYNCDKKNLLWPDDYDEWGTDQMNTAAANLNIVANLNLALGVDSTTIEWMKAEARYRAYGRDKGVCFSSDDMIDKFKDLLSNGDNYFVTRNDKVLAGYGSGAKPPYSPQKPAPARQWDDDPNSCDYIYHYCPPDTGLATGEDFLNNVLNNVATLITVTKYDSVVWSPSIYYALTDGSFNTLPTGVNVTGVKYNPNSPTDIHDRPGAMSMTYQPGGMKTATMPTSYNSGHTVVMRAGSAADLLADVLRWYTDSPHLGPPYHH